MQPPDLFARLIERHKISVLKAGSTFLRILMTRPEAVELLEKHDLSWRALHPVHMRVEPRPSSRLAHTLARARLCLTRARSAVCGLARSALSQSTKPFTALRAAT